MNREILHSSFVPQFYAVNTNLVRDQLANVSAAVGTTPVLVGIALYNQSPDSAAEKIIAAERMGFSGASLFCYESLVGRPDYWTKLERALKANR